MLPLPRDSGCDVIASLPCAAEPRGGSGWRMGTQRQRPAKDGQPYPMQNEELKGGSIGRPDDWLGHMTEALIPVSGFLLR